MAEDKGKKIVADDGVSSVPAPTTPAGGEDKKKKGTPEKMDTVTAEPVQKAGVKEDADIDTTDDAIVEEVVEVEASIAQIVEGMDLSEEFKDKISVVFEAAVNEATSTKVQKIEEELQQQMETELSESVETKIGEIVENLDSYLDYVVSEWMTENEIAIEAGIKVEMAESLMDGLQTLFTEHNIEIDDKKFDIVKDLEEELADSTERANNILDENIELGKEIAALKCNRIFEESTDELTSVQKERLRVLSETLDTSDTEGYTQKLNTIIESFITEAKATVIEDVIDEEDEIMTEEQDTRRKPSSDYASINSLVEALNART
jgi:hypothetical protein